MSERLLDLSEKINEGIVEIYRTILAVSKTLDIPFFVVGATVRDIIFERGFGINPGRLTHDIDLGINVSGWDEFNALTNALIDTGKFSNSAAAQRLIYNNPDALPVDVLPFGPISEGDQLISWPPDKEIVMNVLGFEEAYSHSLLVRLSSNPVLEIKFASPAGWALLKIISWNDRSEPEAVKDAKDLSLLLRHYADVGNEDRLYNEEQTLFQDEEYDLELAGSRLLGKDIAVLSKQESLDKVLEILGRETGEQEKCKLAEDMVENRTFFPEEFEKYYRLIEKLKQGVEEVN